MTGRSPLWPGNGANAAVVPVDETIYIGTVAAKAMDVTCVHPRNPVPKPKRPIGRPNPWQLARTLGVTDCCCCPHLPRLRRAGARMCAISGGYCLFRHSEK